MQIICVTADGIVYDESNCYIIDPSAQTHGILIPAERANKLVELGTRINFATDRLRSELA